MVRSSPVSLPCCSYTASPLQSACSSPSTTTRMFAPWPTWPTGAPPPFTATISCCWSSPPLLTTARTQRSSLTNLSPPWALPIVAASPSGPAGGQNRPKGGRGGQKPQISSSSSQQEPSQTQLAKQAGLCPNHFIYGEKTYNCGGNCSWSGN